MLEKLKQFFIYFKKYATYSIHLTHGFLKELIGKTLKFLESQFSTVGGINVLMSKSILIVFHLLMISSTILPTATLIKIYVCASLVPIIYKAHLYLTSYTLKAKKSPHETGKLLAHIFYRELFFGVNCAALFAITYFVLDYLSVGTITSPILLASLAFSISINMLAYIIQQQYTNNYYPKKNISLEQEKGITAALKKLFLSGYQTFLESGTLAMPVAILSSLITVYAEAILGIGPGIGLSYGFSFILSLGYTLFKNAFNYEKNFPKALNAFYFASLFSSVEERAAFVLQKKLLEIIHFKKAKNRVFNPNNERENYLNVIQIKLNATPGNFLQNVVSSRPKQPPKALLISNIQLISMSNNLKLTMSEENTKIIIDFLKQIQYISIKRFNLKLKYCVTHFNAYLKTRRITEYHVIVADNTSTKWVFENACRYLDRLPSQIHMNSSSNKTKPSSTIALAKDKPLVIFDDWSISGTQIDQTLDQIYSIHPNAKVILVIPYMTQGALISLKRKFQEQFFPESTQDKLTLISCGLLNTMHLMKYFANPKPETAHQKALIEEKFRVRRQPFNPLKFKTLLYSDWKTPDTLSNYYSIDKASIPYPFFTPPYKI